MTKGAIKTTLQELSVSETEPRAGGDDAAIAALAYQLWHERGCPIGSSEVDWFRAQKLLNDTAEAPELLSDRHEKQATAA